MRIETTGDERQLRAIVALPPAGIRKAVNAMPSHQFSVAGRQRSSNVRVVSMA